MVVLLGEHTVLAVSHAAVGRFIGSEQPHPDSVPQLFSALTHSKTPVETSFEVHLQSFSSQGVSVVQGLSPSGLSVVVVVVVVGVFGSSGSPVGTETLLQLVETQLRLVFLHKSSAAYSGVGGGAHEQPPTQPSVDIPIHTPV